MSITIEDVPHPLLYQVLNNVLEGAASLQEATALVRVCRTWYAHVSHSEVWVDLCVAQVGKLECKLICRVSDAVCRRDRFVVSWVHHGLRSVAADALSVSVVPGLPSHGKQIMRARSDYERVSRMSAAVDPVLFGIPALHTMKQALVANSDWALSPLVPFFVLLPQSLFWLAMRADGFSDCPWYVGSCLGLVACVAWMPHIALRISTISRFVWRQRALRGLVRELAAATNEQELVPSHFFITEPPPLVTDASIVLPVLVAPVYYACLIAAVFSWLTVLLTSRGWPLLAAGAALNFVPLCGGAALMAVHKAWRLKNEDSLCGAVIAHGLSGWLLGFQALAERVECTSGAQLSLWGPLVDVCACKTILACVSVLPSLAVCYWLAASWLARAVRRHRPHPNLPGASQSRWTRPDAAEVGVALLVVASLALAHVVLAVILGRSLRHPRAMAVPLVVFVAPMQVFTLLGVVIALQFLHEHRDAMKRAVMTICPVRACRACKPAEAEVAAEVSAEHQAAGEMVSPVRLVPTRVQDSNQYEIFEIRA